MSIDSSTTEPTSTPSANAADAADTQNTNTASGDQAAQGTADQSDSDDEVLGEGGKKALAAERRARKDAETAAAELRRQLDAQAQEGLSDLEKAQKAVEDAEARATAATAQVEKLRIVARHGLSDEDVDLLPDDPDAAERAAARMAAANARPKGDPTQGGMGSHAAKSNGEKFADFANNFFTR